MIDKIVRPETLLSYREFSARSCPVPQEPGIYAWFFRELMPSLPINCSQIFKGFHLLYVGIAPSRSDSSNNLRKRIRKHFNGDASGSTLRKSLGCLLSSQLGLTLRPTGKKGRLTYGEDGEATLSKWIQDNALVGWVCHSEPWSVECEIIQEISPLLNLQHNERNSFHAQLKELRSQCQSQALVTRNTA